MFTVRNSARTFSGVGLIKMIIFKLGIVHALLSNFEKIIVGLTAI